MSEPCDLFISSRRKDAQNVDALEKALEAEELKVWLDRNDIEDAASIQRRIDEGLAFSRALLAWYSVDYPKSRACQWELTAALIAAGAETAPVQRLLVVNPEENASHVEPLCVRDLQHFCFTGDYKALAQKIAEAVRPIEGTLGALRRLTKPQWYGLHGLGSNRFLGRVRELWDIHSALSAGNFAIVAGMPAPGATGDLVQIRGSGGIGKSLLAEEYGLRFGAWWPGGVFWLRAYGHSDNPTESEAELRQRRELAFGSQLADFAIQLGLDIRDKTEREIFAAIGRHLNQPYLWIVDDLPDCNRSELERWLAPGSFGRNLITTRVRHLDALGKTIDLALLAPDEARALLTREHPPQPEEKEAVQAIITFLDGHALALDVAWAACRRLGYGAFRNLLEKPDKDAMDLAADLASELPSGHNPHIAATFLASIRHLDERGRDVLRLAAQLAVAPIPTPLFEETLAECDPMDEDSAKIHAARSLQQVLAHSLSEEIAEGAYTVHGLVANVIRRYDADPDRATALRRAAQTVLNRRMAEARDIRSHRCLVPFIPHAQVLARDPADIISLDLANWLGLYDLVAGRYRAAGVWFETAYRGRKTLLGEEHPDTLIAMNNLAGTFADQGDLAGA